MDEWMNFDEFDRSQWHSFYPTDVIKLTQENLDDIKSLNDRISMDDVREIYLPLAKLIQLRFQHFQEWQMQKATFLKQSVHRVPYVIGIAGSVAVGKSTVARLLSIILNRLLPDQRVSQITTDGFLYPNAELQRMGIMDRKGFPESYDMERLLHFLNDVKAGEPELKAPVYSHQTYDVESKPQILEKPDILIVEGINVLQLPSSQRIYVSDYFDLSLYVDANPKLIEQWYLERFGVLLDTALNDPTNHYYSLSQGNRQDAFKAARNVWNSVDLPNLKEFILPTRGRADVILHKTSNHLVDKVYLRRG